MKYRQEATGCNAKKVISSIWKMFSTLKKQKHCHDLIKITSDRNEEYSYFVKLEEKQVSLFRYCLLFIAMHLQWFFHELHS